MDADLTLANLKLASHEQNPIEDLWEQQRINDVSANLNFFDDAG
jgi:hypothetical protein